MIRRPAVCFVSVFNWKDKLLLVGQCDINHAVELSHVSITNLKLIYFDLYPNHVRFGDDCEMKCKQM